MATGELDWPPRPLAIGDETNENDPWLGTFFFMALYDRELSATDVARNFAAPVP